MTSSSLGSLPELTEAQLTELMCVLLAAADTYKGEAIAELLLSFIRDGSAGVEHGAEAVSQKSKKARHNLCLPAK